MTCLTAVSDVLEIMGSCVSAVKSMMYCLGHWLHILAVVDWIGLPPCLAEFFIFRALLNLQSFMVLCID